MNDASVVDSVKFPFLVAYDEADSHLLKLLRNQQGQINELAKELHKLRHDAGCSCLKERAR